MTRRRITIGGVSMEPHRVSTARFYVLMALASIAAEHGPSTVAGIAEYLGYDRADPDWAAASRLIRNDVRDVIGLGWAERFGRELILTRAGADVLSVTWAGIAEAPPGVYRMMRDQFHPGDDDGP